MKVFSPPRELGVYDPGLRLIHWLMAALIFVACARRMGRTLHAALSFRSSVLPQVHRRDGVWPGRAAHHLAPGRRRAGLCRAARQIDPCGRALGASRALCLDDRDAGQRLSDLDRQRAPLPWFGLFSLPRLVAKDKSLAEATAWAHYIFAWTIAFVLAAHLGAVVWHAAIKRDTILTRMWPRYRPARDRQIQPRQRSGTGHGMRRPDRPGERVGQGLRNALGDLRGGLRVPRRANDRRQNDANSDKIDDNDQGEHQAHLSCPASSDNDLANAEPSESLFPQASASWKAPSRNHSVERRVPSSL